MAVKSGGVALAVRFRPIVLLGISFFNFRYFVMGFYDLLNKITRFP